MEPEVSPRRRGGGEDEPWIENGEDECCREERKQEPYPVSSHPRRLRRYSPNNSLAKLIELPVATKRESSRGIVSMGNS